MTLAVYSRLVTRDGLDMPITTIIITTITATRQMRKQLL
jgi:hypothetical protein